MASLPLPPRPNTTKEQKPMEAEIDKDLVEHTQTEQKVGQETLKLSMTRFEQEQEAGRKLVEYNERRRKEKITNYSEPV